MAKRKKHINLKQKQIAFQLERVFYRLESFNPNSMTLEVIRIEENEEVYMKNFPFAHLPKEIKKRIKPN